MSLHHNHKPYIVGWEITSQCNLSCPHCFSAASRRPHDEMTTRECKTIIDAMAALGVSIIGWTGGEPLLRQDLEDLIDYARHRGIKSNITTNAVLLDHKRAGTLMESGNRAVQISLDGSTPEKNWQMRRATRNEFEQIIEAIRICRDINCQLFLATLLGYENLDDGFNMIELAKQEGVDAIRFCGYTPVGRGKRKDIKSRLSFSDRLEELLFFVKKAQEDNSIITEFDIGFGPVPPVFGFHKCIAGVETFYLKGNGNVYPCTSLLHPKFLVGNIRERPLEEIWNSQEMRIMAAFPRNEIEGPCRACDNFENCRGSCRGSTYAHTGNLKASFPLCLYKIARESAVSR